MIGVSQRDRVITLMMRMLGKPDLAFTVPGQPVARPAGKPWPTSNLDSIEARIRTMELARAHLLPDELKRLAKRKAALTKARQWNAYHAYRDAVRLHAQEVAGGFMFPGAVFGLLAFVMARPASHFTKKGALKPSAPQRVVTVRPDSKNLRFIFEDALNPTDSWKGLWLDDSHVELLPIRVYPPPGREPYAFIRLWGVEDGPVDSCRNASFDVMVDAHDAAVAGETEGSAGSGNAH